jgi:hypothetical protein
VCRLDRYDSYGRKTVPLYLAISRVVFCNIPQFGMSKDRREIVATVQINLGLYCS